MDSTLGTETLASAVEEGRIPPPSVHTTKKEKQKDRLSQTKRNSTLVSTHDADRKGHQAKADTTNMSSDTLRGLASIGGFKSHKIYYYAAMSGLVASFAQLTTAVVTCPGYSGEASYIVAEISALLAILITLPLLIPEMRFSKISCVLKIETYFVLYTCCGCLSILYFLEGAKYLGFVAISFYGGAAFLFFLAWGEAISKKAKSKKKGVSNQKSSLSENDGTGEPLIP